MTLTKPTLNKIALLILGACSQSVFGQTDGFQQTIHRDLLHFGAIQPKGAEWEKEKTSLAIHSREELARTLIAEVGLSHDASGALNSSVWQLYQALDLSPKFICLELEKNVSPGRKASLLRLLEGYKQSEVTAELLRQLKDRRTAYIVEDSPDFEGAGRSMRVCDVACNVLSYNLEPGGSNNKIVMTRPESRKDEIIMETLSSLQLKLPVE